MKQKYQKIFKIIIICEILISSIFISLLLFRIPNKPIEIEENSIKEGIRESTVYPPWTREEIWADIGSPYFRQVRVADIESDGYPEMIIPVRDGYIYIVNYSGGNYNKVDIYISEISGKEISGIEVVDFDGDGVKEIYIEIIEDLGSSWLSQIWQGIRVNYNTWTWSNVLNFSDSNLVLYDHHLFDCDCDGDMDLLLGMRNQENSVAEASFIYLKYDTAEYYFYNVKI